MRQKLSHFVTVLHCARAVCCRAQRKQKQHQLEQPDSQVVSCRFNLP